VQKAGLDMLTSIEETRRSKEGLQGAKPFPPPEHTRGDIAAPHPYEGVIKIAEHISYLKHPELLKAAMGTIALAVAEFHVQTLGLSPQDAVVNMQYTRERLIDPIANRLDNPATRKEARNLAVWFVRSTARFFQEYFEGAEYQPVAYRGNSINIIFGLFSTV
jgi:hypothetical protein